LNGDRKSQWIQALKLEIDSLLNITKSLVPEIPEGVTGIGYHVISATVVLKKEMKDPLTIDKYKVRIPICGDQLRGYEHDTFSPTVSMLIHLLYYNYLFIIG